MRTIVFTGPSLKPSAAYDVVKSVSQSTTKNASSNNALNEFDFRTPAAQGDVYEAALESPAIIAIIDGYFEVQPAIWHKEILWALNQGIHVVGASSLGALRAAELNTYGMQGVGWIYNAYASGEITDDDEVALLHGPQELDYQSVTEPMVNIRQTFAKALEQGVVYKAAHNELIAIAKNLFYKNRTYKNIFDLWKKNTALETWVKQNKVNQKQLDAMTLIEQLAVRRQKPEKTWPRKEAFSHTYYWELMRKSVSPDKNVSAIL